VREAAALLGTGDRDEDDGFDPAADDIDVDEVEEFVEESDGLAPGAGAKGKVGEPDMPESEEHTPPGSVDLANEDQADASEPRPRARRAPTARKAPANKPAAAKKATAEKKPAASKSRRQPRAA
jgi:hypothetical protein